MVDLKGLTWLKPYYWRCKSRTPKGHGLVWQAWCVLQYVLTKRSCQQLDLTRWFWTAAVQNHLVKSSQVKSSQVKSSQAKLYLFITSKLKNNTYKCSKNYIIFNCNIKLGGYKLTKIFDQWNITSTKFPCCACRVSTLVKWSKFCKSNLISRNSIYNRWLVIWN